MRDTNINITNRESPILTVGRPFPDRSIDYSEILEFYNIGYKAVDYHLQIGEIIKTQGWILHISMVISQVIPVFKLVIPFLIKENVPFKIPQDKETCLNLMNGCLGTAQIGKIVSLYPENDALALFIAKELIQLTKPFKGPLVPTDILLGSIVYTRYGSFNAVLQFTNTGQGEKYIYNSKGQLIKDPYSMPFRLPEGIDWPFSSLASEIAPVSKKILNFIYRPTSYLKEDPKGDVYKGVYLKSLFNVKNCVIKQGRKNMSSEDSGRDIYDRLSWQQKLHTDLSGLLPIPKIFDFFQQGGHSYLVMEYIKGTNLYDKIKEINPSFKSWFTLPKKDLLTILDYLITITSNIEILHQRGYIHRDINPVNFLITPKGGLWLIDLELAYSLIIHEPNPPYELGTIGYMSPEQQIVRTPTIQEDIYGLGAMIMEIFTGISPIKIDSCNQDKLADTLNIFTLDNNISRIIATCLQSNPLHRPDLSILKKSLLQYRSHLQSDGIHTYQNASHLNASSLQKAVSLALEGINKPPILVLNDVWYSKEINISNASMIQHKEYTRYPGLEIGIGGVLYTLARLHKAGFNIESCLSGYKKGWEFIDEYYTKAIENIPSGLYSGTAGVAIAMMEGLNATLLVNNANNRFKIQNWLQEPCENLNLANGLAGQCCAIMQCSLYLEKGFLQYTLVNFINILLTNQSKDGDWILPDLEKDKKNTISRSFRYGSTGIVWCLLEYYSRYPDKEVLMSIQKGLKWLLKNRFTPKEIFINKASNKRNGILILLIKAFEVLQDDYYKKISEETMLQLPEYITNNDFTQQNGMAGIGELYLEAARIFNDVRWKARAEWIASVYIQMLKLNPTGSGYWKMEERNEPTADFMEGNSGVIHFMARCLEPDKIGYRFLK